MCLTAPVVQAQQQQHSFFTHYSTEDGLSQNTVMSMLQDHKDNLWFATWDGINRFDGYNFKTYKARQGNYISLTNNRADRMYEDRYGFLWLLTYDNRVHRFDPKTETFEQVPAAGEEGSTYNIHAIQVLPDGTVWLLTEHDGAIRVVTLPQKNYTTKSDIYSTKSGLFPADHFYQVYQDKAGNHWLLTDNGLGMIRPGEQQPVNYFVETKGKQDGMNQAFYAVRECEDDICFASDRGRIWCYQKQGGEFRLLELPTKARITSIHTVGNDNTVVTTDSDGFFLCNLKTNKHTHYSPVTCKELSAQPILSAYVDRTSEVWFEQEEPGVVVHFNPATGVVKREQMRVEYSNADRSRPAFHIHEDIHGHIWVHPYGGGFSYFDRERNCLVPFYDDLGSNNWRFSNKIHAAFSDKQGNLWLCTHSKGLEKVTFRNVPFSMLTPVPHEYESLSNEVRSVCEDKQGNLWIGLKDGMIRLYDSNRKFIGHLTGNGTISMTGTPMEGTAYFIMQDSKGIIWIATKGNGLVRAEQISPTGMSYKLTRYQHDSNDMYSLSDNNVYCVYEDHHGRIWAATFAGGINYISQGEHGETVFINHRNNLKGYPIDVCYKARFITSDNNGRLWVGTTTGAVAFDENFKKPEDIQFHHFSRVPNDTKSLSNNDVHWIIATQQKELYLATFGGGLNKLISISEDGHGEFKSYSVLDGLSSDVLLSIREDHKQNLWISTENGICKFVPSGERFENYDERSISFRVRFSEAASTLTSGGDMLFGTSNGLFMFSPDSIRKSSYVPPVVFSKLMVANEDVIPGEKSILKVDLDDTQELVLSHDENIFSVQYAALDYTNPQNIQYAYILDGFEKQWTFADRQRSVTYTNLPKGDYIFRVRSTNSDGVWVDNERILNITILPSFWETPLAYVLYVCFVLLIIFVAVYILFTIYRLKHEVSVEQQISDIKLRFFTNISHELRTPLTLIAGPVEQVLKNDKLPADAREQLVVVERNTNRMLRLVNQILDFRKYENGKMEYTPVTVDVLSSFEGWNESFQAAARKKHIHFSFDSMPDTDYHTLADMEKLERIYFNLLSNAFKFTPENGRIAVRLSSLCKEDKRWIRFTVANTGSMISAEHIRNVFDRFYKIDMHHTGSGIGLALVKAFVEMHGGTISVESDEKQGTVFTVELPVQSCEAVAAEPDTTLVSADSRTTDVLLAEEEELEKGYDSSKSSVLIIDDNEDIRSYVHTLLHTDYTVIEAADGSEGIRKAMKYVPDLIISDVMMPGIDGIECCRRLKSELQTCHIPVILLTACSLDEQRIQGYDGGADSYISKPFSSQLLLARVRNLIDSHRRLKQFFGDGQTLAKEDVCDMDKDFVERFKSLIEEKMGDSGLNVEDLGKDMGLSRVQLYRKIKSLTNYSPNELLRIARLKKAASLLASSDMTVAEIGYEVGFSSPSYFTKCYKEQFGESPTDFLKRKG